MVDYKETDTLLGTYRTPEKLPNVAMDLGQWSSPRSTGKRPRRKPASDLPPSLNHQLKQLEEGSFYQKQSAVRQDQGKSRDDLVDSSVGKVQLTSTAGSYQSPQSNASDSDSDYSSDLTNTLIFKEKWKSKEHRLRSTSLIGKLNGWNLIPVIVKSNDDLRQEQIASQLIRFLSLILDDSQYVPNKLRAYSIIALTPDSGLIEAIPNTVSIDVLRRKEFGYGSLIDFFERYFDRDNTKSKRFQHAQENFIVSLANYSIVCYLLHLKDRHNGNILITTQGQLIHIDFGFLLGKPFSAT